MNFDVVIIGGGFAGLTCGIALQQQGKRCAIINGGQAAIDFSTGSMDLLSRLPNGENVLNFDRSFEAFQAQLPQHPYSLIGKQKVLEKAAQFEQIAQQLNLQLKGSLTQNHQRVTPLGGLHYTWLSPSSVPTLQDGDTFAYDKIAILGIQGYHDFQPELLAENLKLNPQFAHCELKVSHLSIPELDHLRENSREFRSVNIAQLLAHKLSFDNLVAEIKQAVGDAQAAFLPACFGLEDQSFFDSLKQATGLPLFELPTLPPSLLGIRQHKQLRHYFEKNGGLMMNGDRVLQAEFEGDRVSKIYTQIHEQQAITADYFVLATGSFFSNGLVAEFDQIYEPVFRLDMAKTEQFDPSVRATWTHKRFAQPQPYQSAGVVINQHCQAQKSGRFLTNLYAIGAVIGGYNTLELGCGSGVSIVTALTVADHIGGAK